jgi:nucleoside-diphosphate-sugar epimerase
LYKLLAAKPRVFVSGGGGFIGSALVGALAGLEVPLHVLTGAPEDIVTEPPANVASARAEITDLDAICDIGAGCEIAVHIAGPPSVGASFDSAERYASVHVQGTATMLNACRRLRIDRFIYVSSAEVYGRAATQPVSETQMPDPRSPYAAAKLGAENMVRAFANAFGMTARILRPFSVYGPRQPSYALVPTIVSQALNGDAIMLSDLRPVRDYCYLADVVDAVLLACEIDGRGVETFNVGSGIGTSVLQLAQAVLTHVGRAIPILTGATETRPQGAEIYELVANIDRARDVLDWSPRTSLAAGLQKVIAGIAT